MPPYFLFYALPVAVLRDSALLEAHRNDFCDIFYEMGFECAVYADFASALVRCAPELKPLSQVLFNTERGNKHNIQVSISRNGIQMLDEYLPETLQAIHKEMAKFTPQDIARLIQKHKAAYREYVKTGLWGSGNSKRSAESLFLEFESGATRAFETLHRFFQRVAEGEYIVFKALAHLP